MSTAVKVSDDLVTKAKIKSKIFKRSIAGQIEYWAGIGQVIEENPELPLPFIQEILTVKEEIKAGLGTPYIFGEGELLKLLKLSSLHYLQVRRKNFIKTKLKF